MADDLHGFPFWAITFDKDGRPTEDGAVDRLISEQASAGVSDLFIFSHGWNNDRTTALSLYERFFGEIRKIRDDQALPKKNQAAKIGVVGVIWPSILWPDDAANASMNAVVGASQTPGAASFGITRPVPVAQATTVEVNTELKKAYEEPHQLELIDELTSMLETQAKTDQALKEFQAKLALLLRSERAGAITDPRNPDYAEGAIGELGDSDWRKLLQILGDRASNGQGRTGGAAGLGDPFQKLWAGAKDALRIATYWQMKQRAGIVGRDGLGAIVLTPIAQRASKTRVHLLGHSFGARLVSFSLSGLAPSLTGGASPVKSLFLLQGAFSHYAFADHLPHDLTRSGALKGMAINVDGPLLTTHSLKDLAVGLSYPAASVVNQDDASAVEDQTNRWGAMGHDGAQAVDADRAPLSDPGVRYPLSKSKWLNLDGNQIIIHGGLPSGAHSDIVHPQIAWAALAAADIV